MFYCNACAIRRDWPRSIVRSYGRCELCGNARECNDMPSVALPPRRSRKGVYAACHRTAES